MITQNHAVIPIHKWPGIAASIIGVISIMITALLLGIALSGIVPPRPNAALLVLSSAMLCANLIGIALGVSGARDRSSRKLYPLLGLTLNAAVLMTLVGLAVVGLWMEAP